MSVPTTRSGGPYFNGVSSDFFRTMGMRILRGRGLTEADRGTAARVVVVNQTLASLWWPNEDAIGKRVLQIFLDRALQRPGAVHRVVADPAESGAGAVCQVENDLAIL